MLVQRMMEFITELEACSSLAAFDLDFSNEIKHSFSSLDSQSALSSEHVLLIKEIFSQRWKCIADKDDDYTRDPLRGSNQNWIQLAIDIADETTCLPLQILIPTVTNRYDSITGMPISISTEGGSLGLWFLFLNNENTGFISILSLFHEMKKSAQASYLDEHIKGLALNSLKKRSLLTYDDLRTLTPRALSLVELLRIKSKKGDYSFNDADVNYTNFWDYLLREVVPSWNKTGRSPMYLLPPLFDLMDVYFSEMNGECEKYTFRKQLIVWSQHLQACSVDDINNLYGQLIQVNGSSIYLFEILLDCLQCDTLLDLKDNVTGVVRWLCHYNASYTSSRLELEPLYTELNIGRGFTVTQLKEQLLLLNQECTGQIAQLVASLIVKLDGKSNFDAIILEGLSNIYALRWLQVEKTAEDYRRLQKGTNLIWINLAQRLARDHLGIDYCSLLMPTLQLNLSTMRWKSNGHYFEFLGRVYDKFANDLGQYQLPVVAPFSESPRSMLIQLVDLIDLYLIEVDSSEHLNLTYQKLSEWVTDLYDLRPDDVRCLYKQSFKQDGKTIYFLDFLLECLHGQPTDLYEKIQGLARWLCEYDLSFICKNEKLSDLYTQLGVGPGFNIARLKKELVGLIVGASPVIVKRINTLLTSMKKKKAIDSLILNDINAIFQQRWSEIQDYDHEHHYVRRDVFTHCRWVRLAQLLCGAKLVPANYYRVLMPTLVHDVDSVNWLPIIYYRLDHYIFSGFSYKNLILLDHSVDFYRFQLKRDTAIGENFIESNFFYDCNVIPKRPLSVDEHDSLQYANKKFIKYMQLTHYSHAEERLISLDTVDALTRLVNESLFPPGLLFSVTYTPEQQISAEKAYLNFFAFYHQLPLDERERLNAQIICFQGSHKSFGKILGDLKRVSSNEGCVATAGRYILQLIIDYLPNRQFTPEIENGAMVDVLGKLSLAEVGIKEMRACSSKRRLYDADDFQQRAKTLMVSLLTQSFVKINWDPISFLNNPYHANHITKSIFDRLEPMLLSGDFSQYPDIVHSIVLPSLQDKGFLQSIWSQNINKWLLSIVDSSLFKQENALCNPKLLLRFIYEINEDRPIRAKFEPLRKELMSALAQHVPNNILNEIYVSYKFRQLLTQLKEPMRAKIIKRLEHLSHETDDMVFKKIYADMLIQQMMQFKGSHCRDNFFPTPAPVNVNTQRIVDEVIANTTSLSQIIDNLKLSVNDLSGNNPWVSSKMTDYLQGIKTSPVLPAEPNLRVSFA